MLPVKLSWQTRNYRGSRARLCITRKRDAEALGDSFYGEQGRALWAKTAVSQGARCLLCRCCFVLLRDKARAVSAPVPSGLPGSSSLTLTLQR